jgi:hypothetical protein
MQQARDTDLLGSEASCREASDHTRSRRDHTAIIGAQQLDMTAR